MDLNRLYRDEPALHELDNDAAGFEWIDCHDADSSTFSFLRRAADPQHGTLLVVCNFTPVPRQGYIVGVPQPGFWREILNSDAGIYGGSDCGNLGGQWARSEGAHGRPYSLSLTLPPLAALYFRHENE